MEHQAGGCILGVGVVHLVADDWCAHADGFCLIIRAHHVLPHCRDERMSSMDTELVGSASVRLKLNASNRSAIELFASKHGVVCDRRLALDVIDEHQRADIHVFAHRAVDGAFVIL